MEWTLSARQSWDFVGGRGGVPCKDGAAPSGWGGFVKGQRRLLAHAAVGVLAALATVAHFTEPFLAPVLMLLVAIGAFLILYETVSGADLEDHGSASPRPRLAPDADAIAVPAVAAILRPDAMLARELAQAAAMAQLTARISHELRTPLNAVIGFSELMSRETFGPLGSQRYQDYASHIHECGQSLLKSAEDTLAITSALTQADSTAANDRQAHDLGGLVADAIEQVSGPAQQQSIRWRITDLADIEVVGDRRMLRQVLVNLLSEAIARSRWHGEVRVDILAGGDEVRLDISAGSVRSAEHGETLALCVARALIELQGRHLDVRHDGSGFAASFRAPLALQADFFSLRGASSSLDAGNRQTAA